MNERLANVLAVYGLESANIELICDYDNLVYKVETEKKYALRICSPKITKDKLKTDAITSLVQILGGRQRLKSVCQTIIKK